MTPQEVLLAAARKLRETAKHAAPGPWTCSPVWSPDGTAISGVYSAAHPTGTIEAEVVASGRIRPGYGGIRNPHNAVWIALMHPGLAEPMADWLEDEADVIAKLIADDTDWADIEIGCADLLAVARAVLGGAP